MNDQTRPDDANVSDATRQAEERDAAKGRDPGRMPTPEEAQAADSQGPVDPEVARNEREQYERGANVKGEGQIVPEN